MMTPRKELRLDEPLLNHVSDDGNDENGENGNGNDDDDHDDHEYKQAEGSSLTALDLADGQIEDTCHPYRHLPDEATKFVPQ